MQPADPVPIPNDNRRKYPRFQVASTQIVLCREGFLTALMLGGGNKGRKVCDLSAGGARILVTERLAFKQKVRLKITLEKYQDEIEIGGIVKWCFPSTNHKDFYVGIQFYDAAKLGGVEANLLDEHPLKVMFWKKR